MADKSKTFTDGSKNQEEQMKRLRLEQKAKYEETKKVEQENERERESNQQQDPVSKSKETQELIQNVTVEGLNTNHLSAGGVGNYIDCTGGKHAKAQPEMPDVKKLGNLKQEVNLKFKDTTVRGHASVAEIGNHVVLPKSGDE